MPRHYRRDWAKEVRRANGQYVGDIIVDDEVAAEIAARTRPPLSFNATIKESMKMQKIYYVRYWLGQGALAKPFQERFASRIKRDDRAADLITKGGKVICISRPIITLVKAGDIPEDPRELIDLQLA